MVASFVLHGSFLIARLFTLMGAFQTIFLLEASCALRRCILVQMYMNVDDEMMLIRPLSKSLVASVSPYVSVFWLVSTENVYPPLKVDLKVVVFWTLYRGLGHCYYDICSPSVRLSLKASLFSQKSIQII